MKLSILLLGLTACGGAPFTAGGEQPAGDSGNETGDEVAAGDIKVELLERRQTVRLEILLDLHLDVVSREVAAQRIAIVLKLGRHGRNEDRHGHRRDPRGATRAQFHDGV